MKIKLKKQTHWGCMKPLTVYVNDKKQGKLFNCISMELDVQSGDEISFKEGPLPTFKKIEVSSYTKEIVITNSNNLQQLFVKLMLLFLILFASCLLIQSMITFSALGVALLLGFLYLFRVQSYRFEVDGQSEWHSFSESMRLYK